MDGRRSTWRDDFLGNEQATMHSTGQVRLVIAGATRMVGGYALRYALDHPDVGAVTAIGRRRLGISHPG